MTPQGPCPDCHADLVGCPFCGKIVRNVAAIRETDAGGIHFTFVGFRCPECKREWGFTP